MISFELLARFRKELSITGIAMYETVVAIAERVIDARDRRPVLVMTQLGHREGGVLA